MKLKITKMGNVRSITPTKSGNYNIIKVLFDDADEVTTLISNNEIIFEARKEFEITFTLTSKEMTVEDKAGKKHFLHDMSLFVESANEQK